MLNAFRLFFNYFLKQGVPINTGKKSILVNIKKLKGKEILKKLVEWADVVIVSQIPSQLRSLGVDDVSLKAMNPNVIMAHFDAFGGKNKNVVIVIERMCSFFVVMMFHFFFLCVEFFKKTNCHPQQKVVIILTSFIYVYFSSF